MYCNGDHIVCAAYRALSRVSSFPCPNIYIYLKNTYLPILFQFLDMISSLSGNSLFFRYFDPRKQIQTLSREYSCSFHIGSCTFQFSPVSMKLNEIMCTKVQDWMYVTSTEGQRQLGARKTTHTGVEQRLQRGYPIAAEERLWMGLISRTMVMHRLRKKGSKRSQITIQIISPMASDILSDAKCPRCTSSLPIQDNAQNNTGDRMTIEGWHNDR